jgi:glucose/arabinose dehydrogenase
MNSPSQFGMRFYTGNMFPSEYRNAIFIARHGSCNRSKKFGGDISVVSLYEQGTVNSVDPLITGFSENNNYLARPAAVLVVKDGSMLISDDFNGAVSRVTYESAVR